MQKINFIVLTGRFAAGKDTQATILKEKSGGFADIVSTGDIYTKAKNKEAGFARFYPLIEPHIESVEGGKFLPNNVVEIMVKDTIRDYISEGKNIFLFTGYPRNIDQLKVFDGIVEEFKKEYEVDCVFVEYKVSDEIAAEHSAERARQYLARGEKPKKWDLDDGILIRQGEYYKNIEPMIRQLEKEGRLIVVEAEKTIHEVELETSQILSKERL